MAAAAGARRAAEATGWGALPDQVLEHLARALCGDVNGDARRLASGAAAGSAARLACRSWARGLAAGWPVLLGRRAWPPHGAKKKVDCSDGCGWAGLRVLDVASIRMFAPRLPPGLVALQITEMVAETTRELRGTPLPHLRSLSLGGVDQYGAMLVASDQRRLLKLNLPTLDADYPPDPKGRAALLSALSGLKDLSLGSVSVSPNTLSFWVAHLGALAPTLERAVVAHFRVSPDLLDAISRAPTPFPVVMPHLCVLHMGTTAVSIRLLALAMQQLPALKDLQVRMLLRRDGVEDWPPPPAHPAPSLTALNISDSWSPVIGLHLSLEQVLTAIGAGEKLTALDASNCRCMGCAAEDLACVPNLVDLTLNNIGRPPCIVCLMVGRAQLRRLDMRFPGEPFCSCPRESLDSVRAGQHTLDLAGSALRELALVGNPHAADNFMLGVIAAVARGAPLPPLEALSFGPVVSMSMASLFPHLASTLKRVMIDACDYAEDALAGLGERPGLRALRIHVPASCRDLSLNGLQRLTALRLLWLSADVCYLSEDEDADEAMADEVKQVVQQLKQLASLETLVLENVSRRWPGAEDVLYGAVNELATGGALRTVYLIDNEFHPPSASSATAEGERGGEPVYKLGRPAPDQVPDVGGLIDEDGGKVFEPWFDWRCAA